MCLISVSVSIYSLKKPFEKDSSYARSVLLYSHKETNKFSVS